MNIPLLRKVQAAILKYHDQFTMDMWFTEYNSRDKTPGRCGTAACIAGWAVTLDRTKDASPIKADALSSNPEVEATLLLELDKVDPDELFYTAHWPSEFRRRYTEATTTLEAAQAASDRIDHIIEQFLNTHRKPS